MAKFGEPFLPQEPNTMPRIDTLWAFMSVDPRDGNEGIITTKVGDLWMPLVASDEERVRSLKPIAEGMTVFGGLVIKLVKFTKREEVETYGT